MLLLHPREAIADGMRRVLGSEEVGRVGEGG
jgi:hypothetical protein